MANKQEQDLDVLIRARYPLIYLVSWEEARAEAMLTRLAAAQSKNIFFWSLTRGLCDAERAADASINTPQAALEHIQNSDKRAFYVLKDFHPFLQDPVCIRRLRDLAQSLKASAKTVVMLSPILNLPVELEKDLTVVDYNLPEADELQHLMDDLAKASVGGTRFKIELTPEQRDRLVQSMMGLTLSEAENVLAKAVVQQGQLSPQAIDVILQEIKQIIRKSRMLEYYESQAEFAEIGGLDPLKDWLKGRGDAFTKAARDYGLPQPRGVLLLGVQGCGKSLTCKAISGLWKLPLLRLDMGSIFGHFIGQSEDNMRRAIKTAESVAPCVLWLDEIEKGLSGTGSSNQSDAGTTARVFSTFLTWLQEKTKPVFVAATANNISALPPELLRKGRLDDIFFIDLPNQAERRDIWKIHLLKRNRKPETFDLETLARSTDGFSGGEIEQALIAGLYDAFPQRREVTTEDLLRVVQGSVPLSRTMKDEVDAVRQWARTRARPASSGDSVSGAQQTPGFRHG